MAGKALRATFEDCLSYQEKMRKKLDTLISENRPLRGTKERDEFMQILARSTLGLGMRVKVHAEGEMFNLGSVEVFARWISYQEKSEVKLEEKRRSANIEIGELWKILRDCFFRVWPLALDRATSLSPERIPYEPTRAERFY